jgi:hypothetical protein
MKKHHSTSQQQVNGGESHLTPSVKAVCVFLFLLGSNVLMAQNVGYEWAKSMGGSQTDEGNSISIDAAGNVYTLGHFFGTSDFDPGAGTSNLTASGGSDIFISKLDASGGFVWAKKIGGTSGDRGISISNDAAGNVYSIGHYRSTVDFDPGSGTNNLTSNGSDDIFISKLDASGNFVWAKSIGGSGADIGRSINVDAAGNSYISGYFSGTVDFDPGSGTSNLVSNGSTEIFISKLDASGSFVWAKSIGGTLQDEGYSVRIDTTGNVYSTGTFRGTVDFDPGAGISNLTATAGYDIFISKLDASGNFVWAKGFGGISGERGNSIDVDAVGNVYTTGVFESTVDFDPGAGTNNLTSNGAADIFISKLDASGDFVWAKSIGGSTSDQGNMIRVDASGNVYVVGRFGNTVDFDPGVGNNNVTSNGNDDIFISKLTTSGDFVWVKSAGGLVSDLGTSIEIDGVGNVYTTGYFQGVVDFDPGAGVSDLTSNGGNDVFVLKLSCAATTGTHTVAACNNYVFNGISYTADNTTAKDTLLGAGGCDSIVTLNLTINTVDATTTLATTTISANASGATYEWLDCDNGNSVIPSETNQSYTATANGNYAVIVTENNCTDTSACVNITGIGIDDLGIAFNNLKLYPNPTTGSITIDFGALDNATISIISSIGKEVFKATNVAQNKLEVSLAEFSNGVYFVKIQLGDEFVTQKIVKQ